MAKKDYSGKLEPIKGIKPIDDIVDDDYVSPTPSSHSTYDEYEDPMSEFLRSANELEDFARMFSLGSHTVGEKIKKFNRELTGLREGVERGLGDIGSVYGLPDAMAEYDPLDDYSYYGSGAGSTSFGGSGYTGTSSGGTAERDDLLDDIDDFMKKQKQKQKRAERAKKFKKAISSIGKGLVKTVKTVAKVSMFTLGKLIGGMGYVINKIGKGMVKVAGLVKPKGSEKDEKAKKTKKGLFGRKKEERINNKEYAASNVNRTIP